MARSVLLVVVGLAVSAGPLAVVAQQLGPWPGSVPPYVAPSTTPSQADIAAGDSYRVGAAAAQTPAIRENIERLPPVAPGWSEPLAPVTVSAVWPQVLPPLAGEADGATAPDSARSDSATADDATASDIPGDPLPRMLEAVVIERAPWYRMDTPWLDPWDGSFEMGLDGSAGNSDTFNIRLGAQAKRKTNRHRLGFDLNYHKNTNDSLETANRLYFDGNYERLSERTPWTWFFQQTTEYDEFQPWNVRVAGSTGIGYRFLDDTVTTLTARLGPGVSQEIGGPDQDCVPELKYNIEYEHRLTKRQKIASSIEYYPNVADYDEYRIVGKASWEVLLDEEMNLSLKLCANDRYNYPNPGGKLNDLDYAIVLLWSF